MKALECIRNISLGIGVAILLPLATYWGVEVVYKEPRLDDFKTEEIKELGNQLRVLYRKDGSRHERERIEELIQEKMKPVEEEYGAVRRKYETIYFYVFTITGLIAIVVGGLIKVPFLGMGLVFGGVACLSFGYWSFWHRLNDLLRFISLVFALIILFVMSYWIMARGKK